MNTSTQIGGVEVSELKEALKAADDDQLAGFLTSYALGFGADQFVANMNRPNERIGFIISLANHYPEDWAKATELIKKAAQDASTGK